MKSQSDRDIEMCGRELTVYGLKGESRVLECSARLKETSHEHKAIHEKSTEQWERAYHLGVFFALQDAQLEILAFATARPATDGVTPENFQPTKNMNEGTDTQTDKIPPVAAAPTGYALTELQARRLHDNLRLHEERARGWARQAKNIDEYDAPCRLANSLAAAMEALSDAITRGQRPCSGTERGRENNNEGGDQ